MITTHSPGPVVNPRRSGSAPRSGSAARTGAPARSGAAALAGLRGRSLLNDANFDADEFVALIDLAERLRAEKHSGRPGHSRLAGRNIALLFEKPSTRTRCAFEVAAHDEGGQVTYLGPQESQFGYKESVRDSARVLGRMYDGIEYRGFAQRTVETLGAYAGVPVWNGLTDTWHPTQMLADVLTMRDHSRKPLSQVSCCYLGDGRNNVANSLLVTGATLGLDIRICAPPDLQPGDDVRRIADERAAASGARIEIAPDPATTVRGVDFLYTDVWLSMGEPQENWRSRIDSLLPYQINSSLLASTGNPEVRFLHCLPALHGGDTTLGQQLAADYGLSELEVTDEVFESPASLVFEQAENRLHTIKALMVATLGTGPDQA